MSYKHRPSNLKGRALVFTNGKLQTDNAKTAHGLIRSSTRFDVLGIVDQTCAGKDAGELLDGKARGIPVFADLDQALSVVGRPDFAVVGVAFSGGRLPDNWTDLLKDILGRGISVINGLHQLLNDDPELVEAAKRSTATIYDIRRPKAYSELHFWTGKIFELQTPRIAVLGMDCALGKRTTCRLVLEMCQQNGLKAEMIYTGQTGWIQGAEHGFIFDSTLNDFVSGELEWSILECDRDKSPDLILLEGQSSLRNPSGPCGSELIISADTKGVILQHAPFRDYFEDQDHVGARLPDVENEIELIRFYGSKVLAVTLNRAGGPVEQLPAIREDLEKRLGLPVIDPLEPEQLTRLMPVIDKFRAEFSEIPNVTRLERPAQGNR